jgi:hypothetical protein
MKKLYTIYHICSALAFVLHELSHYLMAIILGVHVSGIKINMKHHESGEVSFDGSVYTQKGACSWKDFLVSAAPVYCGTLMYIIFFFTQQWLLAAYIGLYWWQFSPSDGDKINMKAAWKGRVATETAITNEEVLQNCTTNKPA